MSIVDTPQANVPLVKQDGTLTLEGHLMLVRLSDAVKALQTENTALEARITALEP